MFVADDDLGALGDDVDDHSDVDDDDRDVHGDNAIVHDNVDVEDGSG